MKLVEMVVNFVYRMVFGIICIYFLNLLFHMIGINVQIGLNGWTSAIVGLLGIPGVVLLFVVGFIGGL